MAKETRLGELKNHIKEKNPRPLYLMYGEEEYGKRIYLKKLEELVDDGGFSDFNRIVIDGKTANFAEYDDAFESFPMMSEKKLILIQNSGIFYKANEEQKAYWDKRLSNIPEYAVVIFDEKEVDKRSALFKKISKTGVDVEFGFISETELVTWVGREVLKSGKKMSKGDIEYFVSICDDGMANIKNELDKLIDYCPETISRAAVDKVVSKAVGVKVFELTDCIMTKNTDGALAILRDIKTVKESAFKILYLLLSAFDKMLHASILLSEGESYNEIASKLGVAPFIAKKYANSARGFGQNYLCDRITEVAEIDFSIKNGDITEWEALEQYVMECCEKLG